MTNKTPSIELTHSASTESRLTRLAWLPIPLLLVAILVCRMAGLRGDYPYDNLRLALSVFFYTAVSLVTLVLIGRSFLKSGKPALLLLECGVVLWSLSGTVGDAVSHGDQNVNATIFNLTILLAGMCHLGGAVLSIGPQKELRARSLLLVAGFGVALGGLAMIVWAALAGWTPVLFIQDEGGTPLRTAVLISAVAMFLLSAILLRAGRRRRVTLFVQWYCFALLLLSVGLFGIMIQTSIGCIVNWLARSAQWLGGAYLLVAGIASVRETGRWEVSLDPEAWDDRILRLLTPYLLYTLPAAWRYSLAILVVVAATLLRWAMLPWLGTTVPYNVSMVALIAAAIFLGTGPALLTIVLGDIAVEVFILGAARTGFTVENFSRLAISMVIGFLVCWLFHAIRAAARYIQKSEARLLAFADATFEGICESEGGFVIDCNEQFAQLSGTPRSELIGTSIADMIAPEDRELVLANIHENREVTNEHGMLRRNGTRITVEIHGRPVAPGGSRRYTAVRDITERKHAEEALRAQNDELTAAHRALRASEERYRTLFQTMSEGFAIDEIICDESGKPCDLRCLELNPAFERHTGLKRTDVVGRTVRELFSEAESLWFEVYGRVALAGEPAHFQARFGPLNRWFEVSAYQIQPRRFATVFFDITERKQAQEALSQMNVELEQRVAERTAELAQSAQTLQAERQRLFDVLETLPAMICLLTPDYRIAFANRGFRERFGESHGRHCYEYCFGSTAPCKFCESYRVLTTGQPHHWEVKSPDGSVIDAYDFPFRDADGSPLILEMDIDITDHRRAEQQLRQAHEELGARASQLRALAGELTLSEQRERIRLAKILHDHLQQLLVAAKFRATILGRGGDDVIKQGSKEVEELIDESIAASRSLTAELSPPILNEAGLNAGLQWLARRMTDRQGLFVELEMQEDGDLPQDVKVLLFEAVRELLFNVVKHAHTRAATVNVRRIDDHLQVIVADQGIGFDPAAMPAAGEGGRGFGLFSIQERVESMGGTLSIESCPGKGSRFVLSMPVTALTRTTASQVQESTRSIEEQAMPLVRPDPGYKARVMLADDHAVVRQGIANLLDNQSDMEVIAEAADGQEAVELAAKLLPDIILMDMSMPNLNGVEATRIIHNDWPGIRIIGLSMFEELERAQAMRDAGAIDFVTKSGPAEKLINTIRASIRASNETLAAKN